MTGGFLNEMTNLMCILSAIGNRISPAPFCCGHFLYSWSLSDHLYCLRKEKISILLASLKKLSDRVGFFFPMTDC